MSAADLEALTAEAGAVDAVNTPEPVEPQPDAEQVAQTGNEAAELGGLLTIAAGLFSPVFPSLRKIYTQEAIEQVAAAAVPVMLKRGWSTSALLGKYAEEIGLAAVVFPLSLATYQGITADIAAAQKDIPAKPESLQPGQLPDTIEKTPVRDGALPLVQDRA